MPPRLNRCEEMDRDVLEVGKELGTMELVAARRGRALCEMVAGDESGLLEEMLEGGVEPLDLRILVMHVQGYPQGVVAKKCGCSRGKIRNTLASEFGKKYVREYMKGLDMQLDALLELSVHATRDALLDPDIKVRLDAAKHVHKVLGKGSGGDGELKTGEEIMQEVFKKIQEQGDGSVVEYTATRTKKLGGED